jgi:hypothetical protein
MATNADSAQQWLKAQSPDPAEVLRVIARLQERLATLDETHPDFAGNLEALDVLEQAMQANPVDVAESASLDSSPLVNYDAIPPAQEVADKRAQFESLKQQWGQPVTHRRAK